MKNSKTFVCWFIAILLPWIWLWPFFANPSFSLIDDPVDLKIFRNMAADFPGWWHSSGFHGEPGNGRIRTVSWLMRFLLYYPFAKDSPLPWFTIHYLVLVLVITLLFFLLKKFVLKNYLALTGCALFILNPKTMENFTRLSPNEVGQILWLLVLAFLFYRSFHPPAELHSPGKKKTLGPLAGIVFVTFLFYFSKETSVVLLPLSLLMAAGSLFMKKGRRECVVFFAANLAFFILQRWLAPPMHGYSSSFSFTWATIWGNMLRYPSKIQWLYPLLLALAAFAYRIVTRLAREKKSFTLQSHELWQIGFITLAFGFLAILMPWTQPTPRYIIVPDFLFVFFIMIEFTWWLHALLKKTASQPPFRRILWLTLSLGTLLLLAYFSQAEFDWDLRYLYGQSGHSTPVQDLRNFSKIAKPNARVLYLEFEKELVRAPIIFTHDFFGRNDLQFFSLAPAAKEVQKEGYPVTIISQKDWPKALDQIDYVYWNHRGLKRLYLDRFHVQLLSELFKSPYGPAMRPVYSNLYYPLGKALEGTQVWEIDHEVMRKLNLQPNPPMKRN